MAGLQKNVASQNITFCMISSATGAASTSSSTSDITAYWTKDNSQASAGGTFTSLGPGTGQWNYAPTQAETNATDVGLFVTKSNCIPCNLDFHTDVVDANGYPSVNVIDWAATAVSVDALSLPIVGVGSIQGSMAAHATGMFPADVLDINSVAVNINLSQLGVNVASIGTLATNTFVDNMLNRDMSLGTDSGSSTVRTMRQALRFLRNKFDITAGVLTVYKEDDTTASWTGSVTSSSASFPITSNDPAGP